MLRAKFADLAKVSLRRDDDPCFTLDGLDEDCGGFLAIELERSPDVFNFTISNSASCITILVRRTYAGEVRPEAISAVWVCAHAGGHVVFVYGKARLRAANNSNGRAISHLMTPMVRPWKLPAALKTIARPSGTPFFSYAHLRASLMPVSTASAPVFIGRTMSYPNILVTFSAKAPKTEL
jgi:hypothetical protein